MALLTPDEEKDRATPGWAFANGTEFDAWASIWCYECAYYEDCPLLLVALDNHVPAAWQDLNPGALNRYRCHEFKQKEAEGDAPDPVPDACTA